MSKLTQVIVRKSLVVVVLLFSTAVHAGMIAHYSFDGDAQDSVGTNHGQLFGDTSFSVGLYNQAVSFDGNADWVRVNPIIGNQTTWSMTGYLFLNDTNYNNFGEQRHSIFGEYSNVTNADTDNYISHSNDPNVQGLGYDTFPPASGATTTPDPLSTNEWHSFAIVRDNNDIFVYVDGVLESTGIYESYTGSTATVGAFGSRLQNDTSVYTPSNPTKYSMSGMLDEITFYDHSLAANEISPVPAPGALTIFLFGLLVVLRKRLDLFARDGLAGLAN